MDFMRGNLDILRQKIIDELFVLSIFEVSHSYETNTKYLCNEFKTGLKYLVYAYVKSFMFCL